MQYLKCLEKFLFLQHHQDASGFAHGHCDQDCGKPPNRSKIAAAVSVQTMAEYMWTNLQLARHYCDFQNQRRKTSKDRECVAVACGAWWESQSNSQICQISNAKEYFGGTRRSDLTDSSTQLSLRLCFILDLGFLQWTTSGGFLLDFCWVVWNVSKSVTVPYSIILPSQTHIGLSFAQLLTTTMI